MRRDTVVEDVLGWADTTTESFLLLVGAEHSGRTWLFDQVRRRTTTRVVSVSAHLAERLYPLSGLAMVLNALGDARLAEFAGRFVLTDTSMEGTRSAARDVLLLLRGAAIDPTIVLIDDIDLLDEHSQAVLSYMASRLTATGLRFLASTTPTPARTIFDGIRRIQLQPLETDEALALAKDVADGDSDPHVLDLVCAASGYLPGVIASNVHLLSEQQRRGLAPLLLPLPPARPDHIADRAIDEHPLLLRIAAAPLTSIAALMPLAPDDQQRFEALIFDGVLEVVGFSVRLRSPAVRSALYWGVPAATRRALHRAASASERKLNPALSAWHASQAEEDPPSTGALLTAATDLLAEGFIDAAVEVAERALFFSPDPRPHVDALLAFVIALTDRGEFDLVARYAGLARHWAVDGHHVLIALTVDILIRALTTGRVDVDELEVYVNRYAQTHPAECADALAAAAFLLGLGNDAAEARARINQAHRLHDGTTLDERSVRYWVNRLFAATDSSSAHLSTERSDLGTPDLASLAPHTLIVCGATLSMEERYADARRAFAVLSASHPRGDGHRLWLDETLMASAHNEIRAGRVHEATQLIDRLRDAETQSTLRTMLLHGWAAGIRGRADEAHSLLEETARMARLQHHPLANARLASLQGTFALMRGDFDEARYRFGVARQATNVANPDYLRIAADHVEALHRSGADDRALRAVEELAVAHEAHPTRWSRGALARSRVIIASDEELVSAIHTAIGSTDEGSPFELARTSLACAVALTRMGRLVPAREYRNRAERLFDDTSAHGWVPATRAIANEPPLQVQNPLLATLTDNEMAVLRLIRRGARNKDIAAALFVSLRTVEMRITQIYRKLDARSRSHLLTLLPTDELASSGEIL